MKYTLSIQKVKAALMQNKASWKKVVTSVGLKNR